MKGAILIYGEMRTFKYIKEQFYENLLKFNDIDMFISTHIKDRFNENLDFSIINDNYYNCVKDICFVENIDNSIFIKKFIDKIKKIDIDTYLKYKNEFDDLLKIEDLLFMIKKYNLRRNQNADGFTYIVTELFECYHRYNAFNLMNEYMNKHSINYDYIIIYRADLFFKNRLNINMLKFNDDTIYGRFNFLFIGTYNVIKKYVYNFYEDYYEDWQIDKNAINDKRWRYLSETQTNEFMRNNYKNVFGILDTLFFYLTRIPTSNELKIQHATRVNYEQVDVDNAIERVCKNL